MRFFVLLLCFFSLSCTSIFYLPNRTMYPYHHGEKNKPMDLFFNSSDGTPLHSWHFDVDSSRCQKPKALIIHYHGNAQNLTSHYRLLHWLTEECYEYYIFDYRGFGKSQGEKDSAGILLDARSALKYFSKLAEEKSLPLIAVGQSIGGTLLLRSLQIDGPPKHLKALVIESSFYAYQQIGREKLASFWLTWPFQWLPYILVSNDSSPGGNDFNAIKGIPKLLIYSEKDPVVTYNHGLLIFNDLPEPKWFWSHTNPGHINSMFSESGKYRKHLIQWLDWVTR